MSDNLLGQQLPEIHADRILQKNVVVLRHQEVMEEPKLGSLQGPPPHPDSQMSHYPIG